jgi:hypothetical protein
MLIRLCEVLRTVVTRYAPSYPCAIVGTAQIDGSH